MTPRWPVSIAAVLAAAAGAWWLAGPAPAGDPGPSNAAVPSVASLQSTVPAADGAIDAATPAPIADSFLTPDLRYRIGDLLLAANPRGERLSPEAWKARVEAVVATRFWPAEAARARALLGRYIDYQSALSAQAVSGPAAGDPHALRQAFEAASAQVPADSLSKALHAGVPSAEHLWQLRRAFAGQLGLHSLACYSLGLRATQPQAITVARASGAVVLDGTFDATPPPAGVAVPFRLTRNLQHFLAPHAVDGAFAAAACAAAGALSAAPAAPLELWVDFLGGQHAPWAATGAEAAARVRELSPELAVRKAEVAAAADVHAKVRELIAQATSAESLTKMPPAWAAWY